MDKSPYYPTHFLPCRHFSAEIRRHPQAKLYRSELASIGILFLLKGGYFRAFYRWLKRDYGDWFGDRTLPERTRLKRRLKTH